MVRPTGTVTFLFTDVEGSTRRWERDRGGTAELLEWHDVMLREVVERRGGYVFAHLGDGIAAAFARASEAVAAAEDVQRALMSARESARDGLLVRIGIHTGEAVERDGDYFGSTVNRAARLMAAGHGGQVLISATTARLVPDAALLDLGEHRLRDLDGRERVYQLRMSGSRAQFPPLRAGRETTTNLPQAMTSFVGRETDVQRLRSLVPTARLVSLVGAGGAGKTRLALETARVLLADFPDGVWLAELAHVREGSSVAATIAQAMNRHDPIVATGGPDRVVDELAASIGRERVLLVLDNCEHVREVCARVAATLLARCPLLVVMATSRERLAAPAERVVDVGSLDLPVSDDESSVLASAAGALFVERAAAVRHDFSVTSESAASVAALCRRLDGLPLALELAAARVRLLSPAQILARLDGAFRVLGVTHGPVEHHQTLLATLTWSYDLLADAERALLRRLSVFRGGFTLEAAEAVAGEIGEVVDVLGALVDKSLVVATDLDGARRFHLLETVREFGLGLLAVHDEENESRRRHRDHFRKVVNAVSQDARGTPELRRLRAELDNVRSAIAWSLHVRDAPAVLGLANGYPNWMDMGLLAEQADTLRAALADIDSDSIDRVVLRRSMMNASVAFTQLGELDNALPQVERLGELVRRHPDDAGLRGVWLFACAVIEIYTSGGRDAAVGCAHMGESQSCFEDLAEAGPYMAINQMFAAIFFAATPEPSLQEVTAQALARCVPPHDLVAASTVQALAAAADVLAGDPTRLRDCVIHLDRLVELGWGWDLAFVTFVVGLAREAAGDLPGAARAVLGFLRFCRASGLQLLLSGVLRTAFRIASANGHHDVALRLLGSAETFEEVSGFRRVTTFGLSEGEHRRTCEEAVGSTQAERLIVAGRSWTLPDALQAADNELAATASRHSTPLPSDT